MFYVHDRRAIYFVFFGCFCSYLYATGKHLFHEYVEGDGYACEKALQFEIWTYLLNIPIFKMALALTLSVSYVIFVARWVYLSLSFCFTFVFYLFTYVVTYVFGYSVISGYDVALWFSKTKIREYSVCICSKLDLPVTKCFLFIIFIGYVLQLKWRKSWRLTHLSIICLYLHLCFLIDCQVFCFTVCSGYALTLQLKE